MVNNTHASIFFTAYRARSRRSRIRRAHRSGTRGNCMLRFSVIAALLMLQGCTAVYYVKRNDCWVRETKPWHGVITEDLGPCTRPDPVWSEDRFTRLMQECVAQSDYRWQHLALDAWKRGEPIPERDGEAEAEACATQAARTVLSENEALQARVSDVTSDRERLQNHNEHLANVLGEAANKPAGSAIANATAHGEGTARGEGTTRHSSDSTTSSATDSRQSTGDAPIAPPASAPPRIRLGTANTPASSPRSSTPVQTADSDEEDKDDVVDAVDEPALPFPTTIPDDIRPPDCP